MRTITAKRRLHPTESEAQGVYAAMEIRTKVRCRVLTGELSKRGTCHKYGVAWRTLAKSLAQAETPNTFGEPR